MTKTKNQKQLKKRIEWFRLNLKLAKHKENKRLIKSIESDIKILESMYQTKFIFILSPELDRYINWKSERDQVHKADIVRNAINQRISQDKEYKKVTKV